MNIALPKYLQNSRLLTESIVGTKQRCLNKQNMKGYVISAPMRTKQSGKKVIRIDKNRKQDYINLFR